MPGSQKMNSINLAYFLYSWRWAFRILVAIPLLYGFIKFKWKRIWIPVLSVIIIAAAVYMLNFIVSADHMFYQPKNVLMVNTSSNKVDSQCLVIGVVMNGEAKAYPIRFLGFHHQVSDSVGGMPVIVTYCTVCRTGRVFQPIVNGSPEKFRLVGMDHFNAMFEDATTKSWWRQATGEAIAGKLKGERLPEILSTQTSLAGWLRLHPGSLIMQADPAFNSSYDTTFKYENGKSKSSLTGTDSLSWKDKSWVVGVRVGKQSKAYDWNKLKAKRIILDTIETTSLALIIAGDDKSFFAFELPADVNIFTMQNDTLKADNYQYRLDGKGINTSTSLKRLPAYQEFWHSWRTFHPGSEVN